MRLVSAPALVSRNLKKVLNHPYAIIGTPLSFNSWRINIPTYIPKIHWNIVTIQGRSVLLYRRAFGFQLILSDHRP